MNPARRSIQQAMHDFFNALLLSYQAKTVNIETVQLIIKVAGDFRLMFVGHTDMTSVHFFYET